MEAIHVKNLRKDHGTFALDIPELRVHQGYITGLVGQNGAGKTTLIQLLLGLIPATAGEVELLGQAPAENPALRRDIFLVSETPALMRTCTPAQLHDVLAPFYPRWDEELYRRLMGEFDIPNIRFAKLSKGQQKLLGLLMALCVRPKLLILDEPTANLDPVVRHRLLALLREMMLGEGTSILFSTHITSDLDAIADYVVGIAGGRLLFDCEKDAMLEQYAIVQGGTDLLDADTRAVFVGLEETATGFTGLCADGELARSTFGRECLYRKPTIEEILIYTTQGVR